MTTAPLTKHARSRMSQRGICLQAIEAAILHGREIYACKAVTFVIGRKEIEEQLKVGVNLSEYDGLQVVCANDGGILTVYRNRKLNIRPGKGRRSHRRP